MVCTFFGHRNCPLTVKEKLREVLVELIEHRGVDRFTVGRQGNFDAVVRAVLRELVRQYPQIRYAVVLERLPTTKRAFYTRDFSDTIFPEELECVPPRLAIVRRNEWMLRRADVVVTWVTHSGGGAARFAAQAARLKKPVINLPELASFSDAFGSQN